MVTQQMINLLNQMAQQESQNQQRIQQLISQKERDVQLLQQLSGSAQREIQELRSLQQREVLATQQARSLSTQVGAGVGGQVGVTGFGTDILNQGIANATFGNTAQYGNAVGQFGTTVGQFGQTDRPIYVGGGTV